jgi:hypothetical protein
MTEPVVPDDVREFVEDTFATNGELPRGTWEVSWSPVIDGPPAHIWAWHVLGEEEVN